VWYWLGDVARCARCKCFFSFCFPLAVVAGLFCDDALFFGGSLACSYGALESPVVVVVVVRVVVVRVVFQLVCVVQLVVVVVRVVVIRVDVVRVDVQLVDVVKLMPRRVAGKVSATTRPPPRRFIRLFWFLFDRRTHTFCTIVLSRSLARSLGNKIRTVGIANAVEHSRTRSASRFQKDLTTRPFQKQQTTSAVRRVVARLCCRTNGGASTDERANGRTNAWAE